MIHLLLLLATADDRAAEDALERFRECYRNPSPVARAAAVAELARTPHEKTLGPLASVLASEEAEVKAAAARALGGFADYKRRVLPLLLAALADRDEAVPVAAFEALGRLGDRVALRTVHRHFDDRRGKVAAAALRAAGEIRSVSSIEPILREMETAEKDAARGGGGGYGAPGIPGGGQDPRKERAKVVLPAAIKAMQAISREKWTTPVEWRIWWSRRRATFKIDD